MLSCVVSSRTHLVCLCATRTRDCAPGWAVECAGRGHEAAQPGTGHVRRRRLHRPARAEPSRAEPRGPFEARVEPTDGTRSARASGGQRDEHGMAMSVKYRTDVHTTRRGRRGVDRRPDSGPRRGHDRTKIVSSRATARFLQYKKCVHFCLHRACRTHCFALSFAARRAPSSFLLRNELHPRRGVRLGHKHGTAATRRPTPRQDLGRGRQVVVVG